MALGTGAIEEGAEGTGARAWPGFGFGGGHPFRGGGRPPIFRLRPKITSVPLMYFWLPPDFGPLRPPPGNALGPEEVEGNLRDR